MKKLGWLIIFLTCLNGWAQLANLSTCESDSDQVAVFDLTQNTETMLLLQPSSNYTVTYYQTLTDALVPQNAIASAFAFVGHSGQTIYARASHMSSSDYMVQHFDLVVNSTHPTIPDAFLCTNSFGIPMSTVNINSNLSASQYTFYWMLDGVIIPNANSSNYTAMVAGTYTITATSILTGCSGSDTSIVSPFVTLQNGTAAVDGATVTINATPTGIYEYRLDDGEFQDSNVFDNVSPTTHIAYIRDLIGCSTLAFAFDSTLHTSQHAYRDLSFGPNPVREQLEITNNEPIKMVTISNLLGQTIIQKAATQKIDKIDCSALKPGIYAVTLQVENRFKTFKIVKK